MLTIPASRERFRVVPEAVGLAIRLPHKPKDERTRAGVRVFAADAALLGGTRVVCTRPRRGEAAAVFWPAFVVGHSVSDA
jgi:hypothetical protein